VVRALARSPAAVTRVSAAGAEPVPGDLADVEALRRGAQGCEVAFHAAAHLGDWGSRADFERVNVAGTRNVVDACAEVGVRRLVHVGTEAALLAGKPLIDVDETAPLRPDSRSDYAATKALAEQAVREASTPNFETVVVRPRLVWGLGDTTILPALLDAIERGRFAWIGGGRHKTSTTHVDNAVEGLMLATGMGRPGGVYFVTDGEPVVFRDFITELVATQGVEVPSRSMPAWLAKVAATSSERIWLTFGLKGRPPLTRLGYWLSALETTVDISLARRELGYRPVITIAEGMEQLRRGTAA
jgi:nucleoside-diphosphate-sugar epimerase